MVVLLASQAVVNCYWCSLVSPIVLISSDSKGGVMQMQCNYQGSAHLAAKLASDVIIWVACKDGQDMPF